MKGWVDGGRGSGWSIGGGGAVLKNVEASRAAWAAGVEGDGGEAGGVDYSFGIGMVACMLEWAMGCVPATSRCSHVRACGHGTLPAIFTAPRAGAVRRRAVAMRSCAVGMA